MAKYDTRNDVLICDCGYKTHNEFYSELISEIDKFDNEIEDTELIICGGCKRQYEVTLELEMEIHVNKNKVKLNGIVYIDSNGDDFPSSNLNDATIDDEFNLDNGQYFDSGKIYYIEDKKITHIFSADTDKDQLDLFTDGQMRPEFEYDNGYGRTTDIYHLPVGTKFWVHNGAWNGEIIEINGQKHMHIIATDRKVPLNPFDDYCLSITIENEKDDTDYGIPY